ncbi:MAG: hypothetical protein D6731_18500 [Planctomycetota bacterium]|nr:MAG: hypothetical protein D6731_18500 [Planctomycetota bacterium]
MSRHPRRTPWATLSLGLGLVALLSGPALGQPIRRRPPLPVADRAQAVLDVLGGAHVLREAWRATQAGFYRKDLNGVDWEAVLRRYEPRAAQARTPRELYALINRMLGELRTSHLALMDGGVWWRELGDEFRGRPSLRAGCELVRVQGRLHVAALAEGGPAAQAGLLEGDEVVALDGVPAAASPLLRGAGHDPGIPGAPGFVLDLSAGRAVRVAMRRRPGEEARELVLEPRPFSLLEAVRNSVRTEHVEGRRVGVIHLWHFMNARVYRALRAALAGPLHDAEALVLDVRGRGGSAGVVRAILSLFSGRRPFWPRPVVVLTDGHTRSAKEIFVFHWKRRGLGPVVGERTQGACVGCTFQELSDGSVLMIPRQDVRFLTRGVSLEGRGVAPTVEVPQAPLPYRAGEDRILAAGLREALRQARRAAAF